MKIRYKEFDTETRGSIDLMPEQEISCDSYKDISEKLMTLLNSVLPGNEIKITEIYLDDNLIPIKNYRVGYSVFQNFGGHIDIVSSTPDKNKIKFIVWNLIKDDDWDRELTYDNLEIRLVKEIKEKIK
jgi:hypothetical protein